MTEAGGVLAGVVPLPEWEDLAYAAPPLSRVDRTGVLEASDPLAPGYP